MKQYKNAKNWMPPSWDDEKYYDDAESWSYRRLAWEFLRRNAEYQRTCDEVSRTPAALKSAARKYGRRTLRSYELDYDKRAEKREEWSVEYVDMKEEADTLMHNGIIKLQGNQVAVLFDTLVIERVGEIALKSMLKCAGDLIRDHVTKAGGRKLPEFNPASKQLLILYLRLYDALKVFRVPRKSVAVLYPRYWDKAASEIYDGMGPALQKAISKNLAKAMLFVSHEYETLVPLDLNKEGQQVNPAVSSEIQKVITDW